MLVQKRQFPEALACFHGPDDLAKTGVQVQALHCPALLGSALGCMKLWGVATVTRCLREILGRPVTFSTTLHMPGSLQSATLGASNVQACVVPKL